MSLPPPTGPRPTFHGSEGRLPGKQAVPTATKHTPFQETDGATRQPPVYVIVRLSVYGALQQRVIKNENTS